MTQKEILKDVFNQLEPRYNKVNLFFTVILFIVGVSLLFRPGFVVPSTIDIVFGIIGMILHLNRNRVRLQWKMMLTLSILTVFAIQSLYRGGFLGNGLLALAMIIVLSQAFMDRWMALLWVSVSLMTLAVFTLLAYIGIFDLHQLSLNRLYSPTDWLYQLVTLTLFASIVFFSIYTIRSMLLKSISQLRQNMAILEEQSASLEEQQEKLSVLAYHDNLTNLFNRNYFLDTLPYSGFASQGQKVLMAILDIINFKWINTVYGNKKGDEFLIMISKMMKDRQNTDVVFARIGSNEFAMFAKGWTEIDLKTFTDNCFAKVSENSAQLNLLPHQRFLVAYTTFNYDTAAFFEAFSNVVLTIKYGKDTHSTGTIPFTPDILFSYNEEANLLAKIEQALDSGEFTPYFQGKWDVNKQLFVGYEALSRWNPKTGSPIPPSVFIPLINRSDSFDRFSEEMIRIALVDFEEIQSKSTFELTLSLNISPLFFQRSGFESFITNIINSSKLAPNQIILEITEDIFMSEYNLINAKLNRLRDIGFKVSLDDFGTGYSSLNYLNEITIDELKIDKSFVTHIGTNSKAQTLIELLVDLSHKLEYSLVVEGIETAEQLAILEKLGCSVIQGFYFSKPMSKQAILNQMIPQ